MSEHSAIEWTDATWNPTRGCSKIAQGCKNCYAETFAERFRGVKGHSYERGFDPRTAPNKLADPLGWRKPRRIFVNSMSDLFHEAFTDEYIAAVFGVMAACQHHTRCYTASVCEFGRRRSPGGKPTRRSRVVFISQRRTSDDRRD
jgi:protein gp37